IRHRHALAAQNLNLPKLRDDLVGLVSLVCHCGPPSWSKPYFKVDPFNGGGSVSGNARLLDEAMEEHAGLKDELAEAGEPVDASRMAIVLKSVREQGDIAGRVRSAAEGLKNARSRVARRLSALDPGIGDEAALTSMSVPARAKVQAQREKQDDCQ